MIVRIGLLSTALWVAAAAAAPATEFWYSEREEGTKPSSVRYIVSDDFMRSDDGHPENGFVLLDRHKATVYNVVPSTRTILVIDGTAGVGEPPASLQIEERWTEHPDAPLIDGKAVRELQVFAGEQFCYGAVVVPGLDDRAAKALREFADVLAARQLRTLGNTPEDMRDGCFLTRYLYAPARHLGRGLPIEEWDRYGRYRRLIEPGKPIEAGDELFTLPADYVRY